MFIIYINSVSDTGFPFIEFLTYKEDLKEAEDFLKEYIKKSKKEWIEVINRPCYYKYIPKVGFFDHILCIQKVNNLSIKESKIY